MTLDEMKSAFTQRMNRRDLTANTALVTTFMDEAQMRVQRELRVPAMEKIASVTIQADDVGVAIPADLLELKELRPQATNVALLKETLDMAMGYAKYPGIPRVYSRRGSKWIVGPAPEAGDIIDVTYYAELPALVAGEDTNVVSIIAWDLIVNAACVVACQFYTDKRLPVFEANFQQVLTDLHEQADADELGDDAAVAPALRYPDDCY